MIWSNILHTCSFTYVIHTSLICLFILLAQGGEQNRGSVELWIGPPWEAGVHSTTLWHGSCHAKLAMSHQSQTVSCFITLHVVQKITFYHFNDFQNVFTMSSVSFCSRQANVHEVSARFKGFSHLHVLNKAWTGGSKRYFSEQIARSPSTWET